MLLGSCDTLCPARLRGCMFCQIEQPESTFRKWIFHIYVRFFHLLHCRS